MNDRSKIENLITSCRKGENAGFEKLIDMYSDRLYGYFYRLTFNDAVSNDLLSDVFTKVFENIKSCKGKSFEGWIFRIASNAFYDYLRDKQRQKKLRNEVQSQHETGSTDLPTSTKNMLGELEVMLENLEPETSELIMLRYYSDMTFKEIAQIKAEPIGTILSKVHRGLKKLRELMENRNEQA